MPTATFGPLDELLGTLLETWEQRYEFKFDREKRLAHFVRGNRHVDVSELSSGELSVTFAGVSGKEASELCTPDRAAQLVETVLFR
jgi:hypothetical protein